MTELEMRGSSTMVSSKTYVLKLTNTCNCEGCNKEIKKLLRNIDGVEKHSPISEEGQVSVTGTVDPHKLVKILGAGGKKAQLLLDPEDQPNYYKPSSMNHQERRIVLADPRVARQEAHHPSKAIVVAHRVGTTSTSISAANKSQRAHDHDFELKNIGKWFDCNGCKERGFGSTYRCKVCEHDLHKECYLAKPTISHDFLGGHQYTLQFLDKPKPGRPCYCSACGKQIYGFVYHSQEAGGLYLHPCCSSLQKEVCIDGMRFELRKKVSSSNYCMWCKKKKLPGGSAGVPGWSYYVSSGEGFHIHVYCLTEMVHEAWRKGAIDNVDAKALERMDIEAVVTTNQVIRRGGGGGSNVFWRTVKIFLKAIVSVLLGDPTMIVASVLVELISG